MKTFEGIIDECFRPKKPDGFEYTTSGSLTLRRNCKSRDLIHQLQVYSSFILKPFYGKDINEPVIKICNLVLTTPKRFNLISTEYGLRGSYSENINEYNITSFLKKYVIEDKGTKQKFVIEEKGVVYPTCFNQDESILLRYVFDAWYVSYTQELISKREEKRKVREQKRKDKFRQELTDLYKDL